MAAQVRRLAARYAGQRLVVTLNVPEIQRHEESLARLAAELAPEGVAVEWVLGPGAFRVLRYVFDS